MREKLINKIKLGEKISVNEMLEAFDRVGKTYFEKMRDYTPPPFAPDARPITPLEQKRIIRELNESKPPLLGDIKSNPNEWAKTNKRRSQSKAKTQQKQAKGEKYND